MKKKKTIIIGIILAGFFIAILGGLAIFDDKYKINRTNDDGYESYISNVCACPTNEFNRPKIVNLYRSDGDNLNDIKQADQTKVCLDSAGCSLTTEYRLYQ